MKHLRKMIFSSSLRFKVARLFSGDDALNARQIPKIVERRSLRTIGRDWRAYLLVLLRRKPRNVRVVIFGQGRSGSTLLEDLLCSTGHFTRHGEILGKGARRVRFPTAFLKGSARRRRNENFICHVKPDHLRGDRERAGALPVDIKLFLQSIIADGFKVIHLKRANKLGQFLSQRMAEARGEYHKRDDQLENQRLVVDREQLERGIERRRERDGEETVALNGFDFIEVEYERDLESPESHQQTIDRVLDFLALEHRPVQTSLRKVNRRPMSDIVENYDEFAAWVREMGIADALD